MPIQKCLKCKRFLSDFDRVASTSDKTGLCSDCWFITEYKPKELPLYRVPYPPPEPLDPAPALRLEGSHFVIRLFGALAWFVGISLGVFMLALIARYFTK